jgi:hypothetical protein
VVGAGAVVVVAEVVVVDVVVLLVVLDPSSPPPHPTANTIAVAPPKSAIPVLARNFIRPLLVKSTGLPVRGERNVGMLPT